MIIQACINHIVEPIELYLDTMQESADSKPGDRLWKMEKISRCKQCGLLFLPLERPDDQNV